MGPGSRCAWPGRRELPHDSRTEAGLATRWLDVLLQEAMRCLADITRPGIGPRPAFVFGGAGLLAGVVVLAVFQFETAVVPAQPIDRGLDRRGSGLDDARAANSGHTAIVLDPCRYRVLEPADGPRRRIGRVVEAPGPAAPVPFAHHRAIRGIAGADRRTQIVAAGTVEIGLGPRRTQTDGDHEARQ